MGAEVFHDRAEGASAEDAFARAVAEACAEYGNRGYTGTIAEKSEYVEFTLPPGLKAEEYAKILLKRDDCPVNDKYGPAGCIFEGDRTYFFFGIAPS